MANIELEYRNFLENILRRMGEYYNYATKANFSPEVRMRYVDYVHNMPYDEEYAYVKLFISYYTRENSRELFKKFLDHTINYMEKYRVEILKCLLEINKYQPRCWIYPIWTGEALVQCGFTNNDYYLDELRSNSSVVWVFC